MRSYKRPDSRLGAGRGVFLLLLHYHNGGSYNSGMVAGVGLTGHEAEAAATVPAVILEGDGGRINPAAVYIAGLSPSTRPTARHSFMTIAGIIAGGAEGQPAIPWDRFPWYQLRADHVAAIRSELAARFAPGTANRILVHLRGVLRVCWRMGLLGAEDLARALDVKRVQGERLPAGRDIAPAEIAALFATCDGSIVGTRDRAILGVLRHGLRRSEVVGLDLADVDQVAGAITVRKGKGNKQRAIPLHPEAAAALANWIELRGNHAGALFTSTNTDGHGRRPGSRLAGEVIYQMLRRRARWAGLDQSITLHDFRRTLAGDLLDQGIDLVTVAAIMGHSGVQLVARYDRRPVEARRVAVGRLYMPSSEAEEHR